MSHDALEATFWGLVSGSALILGALVGYYRKVSSKTIGSIMSFGSGVLISALSFELMDDAFKKGGSISTASGFIGGALIYTIANYILSKNGARHRKRSNHSQPSESSSPGSGTAIAIGALIDGIPESVAIGLTMVEDHKIGLAAVIAIFLSNIPESLSSTSGMKKAGRPGKYIFIIWIGITLLSGAAALAGYALFKDFPPQVISATIAVAAGGILAMISSTMIPEAYEEAHDFIGIITVVGFLAAFLLSKMS